VYPRINTCDWSSPPSQTFSSSLALGPILGGGAGAGGAGGSCSSVSKQ